VKIFAFFLLYLPTEALAQAGGAVELGDVNILPLAEYKNIKISFLFRLRRIRGGLKI